MGETIDLFSAKESWTFNVDRVILDHLRYWILDATRLGALEMLITFDERRGDYSCEVSTWAKREEKLLAT